MTLSSLSHEHPSIQVISTLAAIAVITSDEDLLDASISELTTSPLSARLADRKGLSDLVLSSQALADGDTVKALAILESAYLTRPSSTVDRNRYVQLLIQTENFDTALEILKLNGNSEKLDATETSETLSLKGVAGVLAGDEGGLKDLQKAVMLSPWDERCWEGLAWGKKIMHEVGN